PTRRSSDLIHVPLNFASVSDRNLSIWQIVPRRTGLRTLSLYLSLCLSLSVCLPHSLAPSLPLSLSLSPVLSLSLSVALSHSLFFSLSISLPISLYYTGLLFSYPVPTFNILSLFLSLA